MSLKGVGGLLQEMEGLNSWEQKITTTHMKPLSWTKQQSPRDPETPGALLHEDFTTCAASVYPVTSGGKKRPPRNTVGCKEEKSMRLLLNLCFCPAFRKNVPPPTTHTSHPPTNSLNPAAALELRCKHQTNQVFPCVTPCPSPPE